MASQDRSFIGVDVSKLTLEVQLLEQSWSVDNSVKGFAQLIERIRALGPVQVICECTGGYERPLVCALHQAGIPVSALNALHARRFAQASGQLAKTDRLDAALLAQFGAKMRPEPDPVPEAGQDEFAELVRARQDMISLVNAEISRREHLRLPALRKLSEGRPDQLERQIKKLDALIAEHIQASPVLSQKAQRLTQVAGIGRVTAFTILALMPELGSIPDSRASSLAGVAPLNRDSGQYRGQRHIRGGRSALRRVLYMAALVASQRNKVLAPYYQRLLANGKAAKVALTAIMRKLVVLMNRLLKNPNFALAQ